MQGCVTNSEIVEKLRAVAAAYIILGENRFKIIAYENAADSIDHLTSEAKDMWEDGTLTGISGLGATITKHLEELFKTGKVQHWDRVLLQVPEAVFPLLSVPGLGPRRAYKLVTELKLKNAKTAVNDLEACAKKDLISPLEGFGAQSQANILENIALYRKGSLKERRIPLAVADGIAQELIAHLTAHPDIRRADVLGSLRRRVATVGDIDIAVETDNANDAVAHFLRFAHKKTIEQGPTGASILLANGRQIDLRVQHPDQYGSMLQYFTGSKSHNIALRQYAINLGLSLSEYGIKINNLGKYKIVNSKYQKYISNIKNKKDKTIHCSSEEEFYEFLGLAWIPPELREDTGEIQAATCSHKDSKDKLPVLVRAEDIKGDVHIHSNFQFTSSHDLGISSIAEIMEEARRLQYEYVGISDHNPSMGKHTVKQYVAVMKSRKDYYEQQYNSYIKSVQKKDKRLLKLPKLFIMLEVDITPDGSLAMHNEAFLHVDAVIVSIHSSFTLNRKDMTARILHALNAHPKVRIFGHPTGRLIGKRESIDADWGAIYETCKEKDIALEINAYPDRLDLPDRLVREAVNAGVRMVINTDSHISDQMRLTPYGVSVARRGWAEKYDIINTMGYNEFRKWLVGD